MQLYWVWFALLPELTLRKKIALLERFADPEEIYMETCMPDGEVLDHDLTRAEQILSQCRRKGIQILPIGDTAYPARLRNISDPPVVLYYSGILPDFDSIPAIGIVGTRKASGYGLRMAAAISEQIARCGALVVSGGAAGIDSDALKGGLAAQMPTVVVLGCGVDVTYPVSNRKLFADIKETGCLISEYPPETGPKPWHFPERNRIISGISNGVLVIEAPKKSGALITARDAMDQGRDVYVVPGNIDLDTCEGSNLLLQEGAGAAFSGWDVVRQYAAQYPGIRQYQPEKQSPSPEPEEVPSAACDKKDIDNSASKPYIDLVNEHSQLTEQELAVLACIDRKAMPIDGVIARADLPAATVLSVLTKLSIKGIVLNHPGKLVSRNR